MGAAKKGTLHFSINYEYITDLARTWLWDENKELEKCIELLCDCLMHPDIDDKKRKEIAIEVLEGRKKLIGINEGQLVEDGENIRPLTDLVAKKEKEIKYRDMMTQMNTYPYLYLDLACGGYSVVNAVKTYGVRKIRDEVKEMNVQDLIFFRLHGWRAKDESPFEKGYLQAGTRLLQNPRFAFEILGGPVKDHYETMDKCTIYWRKELQKWKEGGLTYMTMNDNQREVYMRNMQADNEFPFIGVANEPYQISEEVQDALDDGWEEFADMSKEKQDLDWYKYSGKPDPEGEFYEEYGWVSPNGQFYSSGFGGHQTKAYSILKENEVLLNDFKHFFAKYYDSSNIYRDKSYLAMIFLSRLGWIKIKRDYEKGLAVFQFSNTRLTSKQTDTLGFVQEYFELDFQLLSTLSLDMEEYMWQDKE